MTLDWFSAQLIGGVLNGLLPAVLMTAGMWLLLMRIPRVNAATRYAAWWAVLFAILSWPLLRWLPGEAAVWQVVVPVERHVDGAEVELLPAEVAPAEHLVAVPETVRSTTLPLRLPAGRLTLWLAAIWAAGVLAGGVRLLLSYLDLRGIVRRARPLDPALLLRWTKHFEIRRPVRLLVSDEISSPLAAGFRQGAVLVPASLLGRLDEELADHVVIHELAHLGRRDDWANLLGRALEAALWFHPVARFILRRLEFERELACDDWVVAAKPSPLSDAARRSYAASLTQLAEWRMDGHTLAASMVGRGSQVGRRVRSLLDPRRNAAVGVSRGVLVLAVLAMGGLWLGASQAPGLVDFQPSPPAPPPAPVAVQAPAPLPFPAPKAAPVPAPPPVPVSPPAPPAPPAPPSGPGFLAALAQAGYGDLDVEQIIELKVQGVTAHFIRQMNAAGFGKLTTRQLVEMRVHGITPTYLAEIQKAGISGYTFDQARELKVHGVRPAEVAAIHALGFGPYDARQVTELKIHGVHEDFFRALKNHGFVNQSHHDIVEAKIHGVTVANLRDAQRYGQGKNLRRVIQLKQAGVI